MSKFFAKTTNRTALILSNFHSTLEASLQGLNSIEPLRILVIKDDPISTQHILVHDHILVANSIRIEKKDVEAANKNRQELYHLLATILDQVKSA